MLSKLLMITTALAAVLVLTSCEETTNPTTPKVAPNAPTNLMATSVDAQTVRVKWTAPATGETPTGYVVSIEDPTSTVIERSVSGAATTTASIDGLTEGLIYKFTVRAVNDTARSTPTATIMWSPAKRVTKAIRIYGTESTMGSGIQLPENDNLTISQGRLWDICLDTRDDSYDIGSPGKLSYTNSETPPKFPNGDVARATLIGKAWTNVASLDDIYESADLTQEALVESFIHFNQANTDGKPFAFVVKTEAGNFAKVLVKATGGKLLQGTGKDLYVDLEVSYQNAINVPYAGVDRTRWSSKKHNGGTVQVREHK
jgi:hypothetical protein